jgi:hypothetical protein
LKYPYFESTVLGIDLEPFRNGNLNLLYCKNTNVLFVYTPLEKVSCSKRRLHRNGSKVKPPSADFRVTRPIVLGFFYQKFVTVES